MNLVPHVTANSLIWLLQKTFHSDVLAEAARVRL